MAIVFNCEYCGKSIKAPDNGAGRRAACPHCRQAVQVPSPQAEDDLIPLAPEDEDLEARRRKLAEEAIRVERELLEDAPPPGGDEEEPPPSQAAAAPSGESLRSQIIWFVRAMADANLPEAEETFSSLAAVAEEALEELDQVALEEPPPEELGDVPPPVRAGLFRELRTRLKKGK